MDGSVPISNYRGYCKSLHMNKANTDESETLKTLDFRNYPLMRIYYRNRSVLPLMYTVAGCTFTVFIHSLQVSGSIYGQPLLTSMPSWHWPDC